MAPRRPAPGVLARLAGLAGALALAGAGAPAAASIIDDVRPLVKGARYDEASAIVEAALASAAPGTLEEADALDASVLVAISSHGRSGEDEARARGERAVALRERLQGDAHADLAFSLSQLATLLRRAAAYDEARPRYERALRIQEAALGPDDVRIADTLNGLGQLLDRTGDFAAARAALERAVRIVESGGAAPDRLGVILINLGNTLRALDELPAARAAQERALAIQEGISGPDSPRLIANLAGLGNVLVLMGEYEAARGHYERELALAERGHGADSRLAGIACTHLAVASELLGDYVAARGHAERALAIAVARAPEHPETAGAWNGLGTLLLALGDAATAKRHFERARDIWVASLGPDHFRVAQAVGNLGRAEHELGDNAAAARLLGEALGIQDRALGPGSAESAFTREELAEVLAEEGRFVEAIDAAERAVAIREQTGADASPLTAQALVTLGGIERMGGAAGPARGHLLRALEILAGTLGASHPLAAAARAELAAVDLADGRWADALAAALDAERLAREHVRTTVRFLPERQALRYEETRASGLDVAVTAALRAGGAPPARAAWNAVVRSRAVLLDEMAGRSRAIRTSGDAGIARAADRWQVARQALARLAVQGADAPGGQPGAPRWDAAAQEKEAAERVLAAVSAPFRARREVEAAGLDEVARALPPGGALIAWVRTRTEFAAFVWAPGGNEPRLVGLGDAAAIDDAVTAWNRGVAAAARSPADPGAAWAAARAAGDRLRSLAWDPVAGHVASAERVFLVPDGSLHLISFATLPVDGDAFVLERTGRLHSLSAERDLLSGPVGAGAARGEGLLVFADAAFGDAATAPPASARGTSDCAAFRSLRFEPLPGTEAEAVDVENVWKRAPGWRRLFGGGKVRVRRGPDASEEAFKAEAPAHRALHVASHGFFVEPRCAPGARDNPLLYSGLALAGANARDDAPAGRDDGMLTAEEVAALDLGRVDWVVLSACETGRGEVVLGEGVFGLRRAFQVAGARTVIVSLWPVDDAAARVWVRELYDARFARRRATDEAVDTASRALLGKLRARGIAPLPHLWGNFVAVGDWR